MDRSLLSLTNDVCFCVSGTVIIHPTAAIATNVVLHANPGSRIVIGAGVVVGRGSILHADGGILIIDSEVVLGTKVLLIGRGTVGKNACIGPMTTIMANICVQPGQVIPPNSLIGAPESTSPIGPATLPSFATKSTPTFISATSTPDPLHFSSIRSHHSQDKYNGNNGHHEYEGKVEQGARVSEVGGAVEDNTNCTERPRGNNEQMSVNNQTGVEEARVEETRVEKTVSGDRATGVTADVEQNGVTHSTPSTETVVYGQASVQRLIKMMFPHRSFNSSGEVKE